MRDACKPSVLGSPPTCSRTTTTAVRHFAMKPLTVALLAAAVVAKASILNSASPISHSINLWLLGRHAEHVAIESPNRNQVTFTSSTGKDDKYTEFPPQWFEQPLDHFAKESPLFKQRYWVSKRHYRQGGPVIVLDGGETSGEDRLLFLDTGIVDILAKATGGMGVILEHRYYGELQNNKTLLSIQSRYRRVDSRSQLLHGLLKVCKTLDLYAQITVMLSL